jgi:hypothetical protein
MNHPIRPVETGNQTNDAASPLLQFGQVIDLHPVFAAMAQAREVAEAKGTQPVDVVWDPAWPDLPVDNDDYWNDLVNRNWKTLSRWYSTSLSAGPKGKLFHFKVVAGVETCRAIEIPTPEVGMSVVEHAIYYAGRGWPVFPCNPMDKSPLVSSGFKSASTDKDQIRAWWRRWPNAMIGVRMGAKSGVWAIDPDAPKHGSPDGVANWAELVARHGRIPHTHAHNTPNGGQHLLFKWRDDRPVNNREGGLRGLGINVRGEGGYIVVPPSCMADGRAYEIAEPLDFFNFADAPDWLYDLILSKSPASSPTVPTQSTPSISQQAMATVRSPAGTHRAYADAALRGEYEAVVSASHGGRNNQLNSSTFKLATLVGAGVLTEQEVETAMTEAAGVCGLVADDGRDKCLATIRSGLSAGVRSPRDIPERHVEKASEKSEAQPTGAGDNSVRSPTPPAPIGIPLTFFDDVESFVEKNWLMKGVIAKGETSMWIAPPGKLKSALMTDMAVHLASGMDWRGYQSKEVCGVVYFALERADLVKTAPGSPSKAR